MLTPSQRTLRARVAAYARAAKYDGRQVTSAAWVGRWAALETKVDPAGSLPADERQRRAHALLRSQMSALSLKASRARARKKASPASEEPGEAMPEVRRDRATPTG